MASRRPPLVLRLRREAVYAAIVVVALFTVTEIVLRVRRALIDGRRGERPYSIRNLSHDGRPINDEDGVITLLADPHLIYRMAGGQKSPVVTINADGFRGGEWKREKPAGTKRVVVLGGSAAFGFGASGDATVFAAALERRLDEAARARGGRVEVWNAGVVGYDTNQELVLLATRLVDVAPDLVICFDGWNDFRGSGMLADPAEALLHPTFTQRDADLERRMAPAWEFLRHLELVRTIEKGMARRLRKSERSGPLGEYHDHSDVALPRFERNLRAMVRLARSYGAQALLAPQPELFQRANPPPKEVAMRAQKEEEGYGEYARTIYPRFVAAAAAVAAAESAALVDCSKAFDAIPDPVFTDFVHFDDRGHERVADYLAPAVVEALAR